MPLVCGVKFRGTGKVYFFSPGSLDDLAVGESVIVETARGKEIGEIRQGIHQVDDQEIVGNLKPVVRRATKHDLVIAERYRQRELEALERCEQEIERSGLDMKVVSSEYNFDGSRLTFFFTSDHRVDFRELVRDLARVFRTRIDLRQIGVRDEAKMIGGIGKCGRELCCATWMQEFCPVSIRMAKTQNLPLTPLEISGLCGRLLCCLNYENEAYREVRAQFPKVGKHIETSIGPARVRGINVIKELAEIELQDGTRLSVSQAQLAGEEAIEIPNTGTMVSTSAVRRALDGMNKASRQSGSEESQREAPETGRSSKRSERQSRGGRKRRSGSGSKASAKSSRAQKGSSSGQSGQRTDETKPSANRQRRRRPSGQKGQPSKGSNTSQHS